MLEVYCSLDAKQLLSEADDVGHWICARREDENQRGRVDLGARWH